MSRALRDQLDAIAAAASHHPLTGLLRTGWDAIDAALPGGGLARGMTISVLAAIDFINGLLRHAHPREWVSGERAFSLMILSQLGANHQRATTTRLSKNFAAASWQRTRTI